MSKKKIKILKDGPYLVSGCVPLREQNIIEESHINIWGDGKDFPVMETMALCRCGRSQNAPFCDGRHITEGFTGDETASRANYRERAELLEGAGINLLDDGRCALARFCYVDNSDVWELTENSDTAERRDAAIEGASACPAGRLTSVDKSGNVIEPALKQEIVIIQGGQENIRSGLYVKGGIPLESSDGGGYETRNRYVLCCCGLSSNKPFCDASHQSCEKCSNDNPAENEKEKTE